MSAQSLLYNGSSTKYQHVQKKAVTVSDSKKAVQHMPHSLFVKHRQDADVGFLFQSSKRLVQMLTS